VNFAASQEIPRIYGTRKSLTVPTSARQLYIYIYNYIAFTYNIYTYNTLIKILINILYVNKQEVCASSW
jgi:hypothetical protein